MVCHVLSLGLDDDKLVSAIILHDVYENCGVALEDLQRMVKKIQLFTTEMFLKTAL